jgi:hypothetical protein
MGLLPEGLAAIPEIQRKERDCHERDHENLERATVEFSRLINFVKDEFPADFSEGDSVIDTVIKLLTRYKRRISMETVGI